MVKKRQTPVCRTGRHEAGFKAKVALEAVKGEKTIAQLASQYGAHPNQIGQWKKKLLEELPVFFSDKRNRQDRGHEELEAELYRQTGKQAVRTTGIVEVRVLLPVVWRESVEFATDEPHRRAIRADALLWS